jgi:hypothetical protein
MKSNTTINACLTQTGIAPRTTTEAVFSFNQKEKIMNNRNYQFAKTGEKTVKKIRSLIIPVVMFLVLCGTAPLAFAQEQSYQPPTAAELDEFRQDFDQMIQEMYRHRETLRQNKVAREALEKRTNARSAPALPQVRQQLQQMSYEELAVVHKALTTQFPEWREAPQELGKLANKIGRTGRTIGVTSNSPDAIIPDNCQDAYNVAPSWSDYSVARAISIAADGAQNIIPPPFNAVASAVYIAAEESALVLETFNLIYERCSGDADTANIISKIDNLQTSANTIITNDNANTMTITGAITGAKNDIVNNDNSNKTTITTAITNAQTAVITAGDANSAAIITNDNSNKTMIVNNDNSNAATLNTNLTNAKNTIIANDNTNTTNIVNNDNANKTTIVNNDNANTLALNDLILRSQIEADLAAEPGAVKVAWYMTPTANGGKLDLVQSIVTLTLANIQAAGGSIGNAQSFLTQANADKAAGNFKSAYDNYRKAYKAAAN